VLQNKKETNNIYHDERRWTPFAAAHSARGWVSIKTTHPISPIETCNMHLIDAHRARLKRLAAQTISADISDTI
jgi:hypothetical protein